IFEMAPALIETPVGVPDRTVDREVDNAYQKDKQQSAQYKEAFAQGAKSTKYEIELHGDGKHAPAAYPHYLPYWDDTKLPPYEPFEAVEPGLNADPTFPNLLASATVKDLTANIGAEVDGVQISKLNNAGKDELARFVAEKKVVAFRNQDFADLPIQQALDIAEYFGPSHIHPASGAPKGFPKVHLVHRSASDTTARDYFEERTNSITWHSDAQAALARGSIVRRDPVSNVHPIVRTHPVTGEKALFVNPQFTRRIVGFKKEESDFLLKFLYDHIAFSADMQARLKWEKGTVIVWDNRVTAHTALLDWEDGQRRHLARLTPRAERPFETPFESN
ncbi:Alpha-ketoglutarate-dependent sulfonate dioxygenase, partial [Pseudocercospora fuligena]